MLVGLVIFFAVIALACLCGGNDDVSDKYCSKK
jgi:hypothetical protein